MNINELSKRVALHAKTKRKNIDVTDAQHFHACLGCVMADLTAEQAIELTLKLIRLGKKHKAKCK